MPQISQLIGVGLVYGALAVVLLCLIKLLDRVVRPIFALAPSKAHVAPPGFLTPLDAATSDEICHRTAQVWENLAVATEDCAPVVDSNLAGEIFSATLDSLPDI